MPWHRGTLARYASVEGLRLIWKGPYRRISRKGWRHTFHVHHIDNIWLTIGVREIWNLDQAKLSTIITRHRPMIRMIFSCRTEIFFGVKKICMCHEWRSRTGYMVKQFSSKFHDTFFEIPEYVFSLNRMTVSEFWSKILSWTFEFLCFSVLLPEYLPSK